MNPVKIGAKVIKQGETTSYITAVPINLLLDILEIPDPNKPFEDNRRVRLKHAREFGDYWENQFHGWVVPPLLLDTEEEIVSSASFERDKQYCEIEIHQTQKSKFKILDGQHRVLGWYLKNEELKKRYQDANVNFNKAVFNKDTNLRNRSKEEMENIEYIQKRLQNEYVGVLIITGISSQIHRQFFVDIAKNALGINKTVQAKFDVSSIVNRVTVNLMDSHEFLKGRVDTENIKCTGENENLLSVVNLADIVRHVGFGINRRVSSKKELEYDDNDLFQISVSFFNSIIENYSILRELQDGSLTSQWLRENTLLGSGTIWRCLAGAFHNTCIKDSIIAQNDEVKHKLMVDKQAVKKFEFFVRKLEKDSKLPISSGWYGTGFFPKRSSSGPTSRTQDLLGLSKLLEAWVLSGDLFHPRKLVVQKGKKRR